MEEQRGPAPSEQTAAAIARGLRLSIDERDRLFQLAGHNAPVCAQCFVGDRRLRELQLLGVVGHEQFTT